MSTSSPRAPHIISLAQRLENDIQERGLGPGDPYLSAGDAARLLGVSTVAANRALQLLEKRDLLHRRQRKGTFIAHPTVYPQATSIDRVHMLVHRDFLKTEGLLADGVVLGVQEKLPQADIQFNFLPASDEGVHANGIVSETLGSSRVEGFVMVRAPLAVQRVVQSSGLPAVIYGTPFPSIGAVPWIDRDHYQVGRLAAARLIRQGFREITIITRERMLAGDYRMLDGVRDEMNDAGLSLISLRWRPVPPDAEAVQQMVLELLESETSAQGLICRSLPLADAAARAIAMKGLRLGVEADVVVLDVYQTSGTSVRFPYLLPVMTPEMIGQHIGQMLWLQAQGTKPNPSQEVIQVELREPIVRSIAKQDDDNGALGS